jgi:hypothetical protein
MRSCTSTGLGAGGGEDERLERDGRQRGRDQQRLARTAAREHDAAQPCERDEQRPFAARRREGPGGVERGRDRDGDEAAGVGVSGRRPEAFEPERREPGRGGGEDDERGDEGGARWHMQEGRSRVGNTDGAERQEPGGSPASFTPSGW